MLMELQGKKKTRDFLSLYTKESSFQLNPQGFLMKRDDFLQPVERGGPQGTCERRHVSRGDITCAAVKKEANTCGSDFRVWDSTKEAGPTAGQWSSQLAAALSPPSFGSLSSSRSIQFPDKKQPFMDSASRFTKGFEDDEEDDEDFGRRDTSSHKELNVKIDGKTGEQKACTPRSKHSATEQRRRSKINDRFQILRELLPNSDQKRDKASFLLEVIDYIQFLQEKLQKFESMYPGCSDEMSKLMPWNNLHGSGDDMVDLQMLKNGTSGLLMSSSSIPVAPSISSAQNPTESDLIAGVSYKELESPNGFSNKVAASPASLHPNLYPSVGRGIGAVGQLQQRLIPEEVITGSQSEWLRSSFSTGCTVSNDEIKEQEELTIDEGTISVSSEYSQGLLNTLSQALQNSGIDLSHASISVQINLARRTSGSRRNASSMATPKEQDEQPLSNNRAMNESDDSQQATKKHKSDHS